MIISTLVGLSGCFAIIEFVYPAFNIFELIFPLISKRLRNFVNVFSFEITHDYMRFFAIATEVLQHLSFAVKYKYPILKSLQNM